MDQTARGHRVGLTSRYLTREGEPWFPVSGELHPTRVPRQAWERRLRAMKAGGVGVVAAYVIWIHHQPEEGGAPSFDDNRDIAGFVDLAARVGLDVVLRIGPWCHGEVRNGGFPDWVQAADVTHRTNDPDYLALVEPWFRSLAAHLGERVRSGSNVVGVQLDNELYDQPDHIARLKSVAIAAGFDTPLWLATAWGSAQLPTSEVLPMFGGYGDGFWVDADAGWHDSFREHFLFSHVWDDPGIGADVRELSGPWEGGRRSPSREFPPVTCELGGGMATAYHRRPLLEAEDIAAVANVKIGNGSAWQGYYMYAGGLNPAPGLQESQATGYPNDLPQLDYDFHAPIGAAGQLTRTHALLRQQHAFLEAVGPHLVQMPSSLPDVMPTGVRDDDTLRWALRSDGRRGFVFVNRHQPHEPLGDSEPVSFSISLDDGDFTFPDQPVSIPAGTIARLPFLLPVGETVLEWAIASLLTSLHRPGGGTLAVLVATEGLQPRFRVGGRTLEPAGDQVFVHEAGRDAVVVLPATVAETAWVLDGHLYLSADEVDVDGDRVTTWVRHGTPVARFDTEELAFEQLVTDHAPVAPRELHLHALGAAGEPPVSYGAAGGRASAPTLEQVLDDGAGWAVAIPPDWRGEDLELTIEWTGDVAVALGDGALLSDRFWDGTAWVLAVPAGTGEVAIHVVGLHPQAPVWLHPDAGRPEGARVDRVRAQPVLPATWTRPGA